MDLTLPLLAVLGAALAYGVGAVLQGVAVGRVGAATGGLDPHLLVRLLREGPFVVSLALNALGFVLHVVSLQSLPLFLVQVALASSVAVTALLSARVLHARLQPAQWAGVAAICVGLVLLSGAAETGASTDAGSAGVRVGLGVVVVATAVGGLLAARVPGPLGGTLLGLLGGVGFGVVAVAARILPTGLAVGDVLTDPATLVLCLSGLTAFLLYATAMQHGSVTLTTAMLVVTQTAVPAVLGLALLGDRVKEGAAWRAVLGFLLAVAAAVVLARTDPGQTAAPSREPAPQQAA